MSNVKYQMSKKGFTLIEITAAIAISLLLLLSLYSLYLLGYKSYEQQNDQREIIQNGRVVLNRLTRGIRQTQEIVSDLPESEEGALSEIEFQDGHNISFLHYIRYFLENNNLRRQIIVYCFEPPCSDPSSYVFWNARDENENLPSQQIKGIKRQKKKQTNRYCSSNFY